MPADDYGTSYNTKGYKLTLDISRVNKTDLLLALYNNAKKGLMMYRCSYIMAGSGVPEPEITRSQACAAVQLSKFGCRLFYPGAFIFNEVDLGAGTHVLNVDLSGDTVDLRAYIDANKIVAGSYNQMDLAGALENLGINTGVPHDLITDAGVDLNTIPAHEGVSF